MVRFAPVCFHPEKKPVAFVQSRNSNISSSSNLASFPCRKHTREQTRASSHSMAQSPSKLMDAIRRPVTAASSLHQSAAKHLQPVVTLAQRNGVSRRCLLTLLASAAAIPEAGESRKALLQDYVKRSKENKEKNDKERRDDVYKRNYKDYFGFMEGPVREKKEEDLTESEKGILAWLDKNK